MKILLQIILLSVFSSVYADGVQIIQNDEKTLKIKVQQSYISGDGDTRIDARNIALQQAKLKAAEKAGTYVQAQRKILNNEITNESIKTISTALISSEIINEKFSLTQDGRTKITIIVDSTLDKKSFLGKLGLLKDDNQKKKQLEQLQKENADLKKELQDLSSKLAKVETQKKSSEILKKPRQELINRRDVVLTELQKNESNIRKIFQRGTLFALAKKSSSDYEKAKKDIEINVRQYIQKNTQITLNEPKFKDLGNGKYDIEIYVHWYIDPSPILSILNKYFWDWNKRPVKVGKDRERDNIIEVSTFYNEKEEKKLAYSDRLYGFYTSKKIFIQLMAGKYSGSIRIADIDKKFFGCKDRCYKIQIKSGGKVQFDQNPVVIRSVPEKALQDLTSIDAKVIVK